MRLCREDLLVTNLQLWLILVFIPVIAIEGEAHISALLAEIHR